MGVQLDLLYDLQHLDTKIAQIEELRNSLDDGSKLAKRIESMKAELTSKHTALRNHRRKLRAWELEFQSTESKCKELQDLLYSGKIRNPKELQGVQEEIKILNSSKDKLENEILELMFTTESGEKELSEMEHNLANLEKELEQTKAEYNKNMRNSKKELDELAHRRTEVVELLTESIVKRYEDVRAKNNNLAVVRVERTICGGCRITLPEYQLRELRQKSDKLIFCENCGRILYWEGLP